MARHAEWTLRWYFGRVKYELRWLPHSMKRVLRGESRCYAPLRTLWHALVLMYEYEICEVCGHPVAAVWHAEDALWMKVNGRYGGIMCASCFNKKAERAGASPYWEVHDGEFPTCTGSPCVHVARMRIQADAAAECLGRTGRDRWPRSGVCASRRPSSGGFPRPKNGGKIAAACGGLARAADVIEPAPSDVELEGRYPWVPWRAPFLFSRPGGDTGLACRYCLASFGFSRCQLFGCESDHQTHLDVFHPRDGEQAG